MKNLFITTLALLLALTTFAQSPERMSYQAVVRDAANKLVTNGPIGMAISIHQGSATGTVVYAETHTTMTNDNGLVSVEIGNGTPTMGTMAGIDWGAGPYFLETETDPTGGTNYTITGTSQFATVPYAMQSTTADHAATADLAANAIDAQNAVNAQDATNAINATHAMNADRADVTDSANVAAIAWDVKPRKRSVVITPGMVNDAYFAGSMTHGILTNASGWPTQPCLLLPESGPVWLEFMINFPMPSDYRGTGVTARVLYVTSTDTGMMDCRLLAKGTAMGGDLVNGIGGSGSLLPPSATPTTLSEWVTQVAFTNSNTKIINLRFRRRATSPTDTSLGDLRILGIVLEYND